MGQRRRRLSSTAVVIVSILFGALQGAAAQETPGDPVSPLPPGFVASTYSRLPGLGTSLSWGPDTREGADGERLYVLDNSSGRVMVIDDVGGVGSEPDLYAGGFSNPLGVLAAPDGTVYVADNEGQRPGPYGTRPYGRVWRVTDTDHDGVGDKKVLLLKDLPNGRHNTNGMAIGPDGFLYITNGNSTDDGIEGGEPEVKPWSGAVVRVKRNLRKASLASLPRRSTLVATGMRNIYDIAFSPVDPTKLFIPMNGVDDARKGSTADQPGELEDSDDVLFLTDIDDTRKDHMGFPMCLYNQSRQGNLRPYNNPNPDVIKKFGRCPKASVTKPVSTFGLHPSSNGLAFQTTTEWGEEYKNNVFVAEFGNFFGDPAGHDLIRVELDASGTRVVNQSEFFNAPLLIDVDFDKAGNMYVVSFDGTIYRIAKPV